MILVIPESEHLASFRAALERGWSPSNIDSEKVRLQTLEKVDGDPSAFLASLQDERGAGEPITLPDGSTRARLPSITRWLWDGELCGAIQFRWQPGTTALPDHVPGHIGYSVVPWKRGLGYATGALREILPEARARGLERVELTADENNRPSWRVIEKAGGTLEERLSGVIWHEAEDVIRRYIIELGSGEDQAASARPIHS